MDHFRTFLNWCLDVELIARVPPFPVIQVSDPLTHWITREEQDELLKRCPEEDWPIISFLILHGCRPAEARALRIQDIHLAAQAFTISSTWSGNVLRPHRKNKKSPPVTLPIHPDCMNYIRKRYTKALPGAFVFINPRSGNHYTDSALDRVWKGILKRAKIKGLKKYDATRHSFATNLVNNGVSIYGVRDLLGHTTVKTTERYAHADLRTMRLNLEKMNLKKVIGIRKAQRKAEK
jgi:integrase